MDEAMKDAALTMQDALRPSANIALRKMKINKEATMAILECPSSCSLCAYEESCMDNTGCTRLCYDMEPCQNPELDCGDCINNQVSASDNS